MAAVCSLCARDRGSERNWRVCSQCPDVQLDVEHGKLSATSERWYCPRCVKVLEKKRFLWVFKAALCGHCQRKLD